MVDLEKVSKAVKNMVSNISKQDGNKRKIDSKNEYDKLANYLAGNQDNMNVHEKNYIEGFMIEYETNTKLEAEEAEKKRVEDATTDSTKESVKKIAKRLGDKKSIDADEEAQALVLMLRNTKGDLNKADIEYIKNILRESGYEKYIPAEDMTGKADKADKATPKPLEDSKGNTNPEEITIVTSEDIENQKSKDENLTSPSVQNKDIPAGKRPKKSKITDRDYRKPKESKPSKPDKPVDETPDRPVDNTPDKPIGEKPMPKKISPKKNIQITESGRNRGLRIAERLSTQIDANYTDNDSVRNLLRSVNESSAYTFVSQFANKVGGGLNQDVFSVSDLFDKLSYRDTLFVMKKLLAQAKNMGLESNPAYKALSQEVKYGETAVSRGIMEDPDKNTQVKADSKINWLYNEMSKMLQKAQ